MRVLAAAHLVGEVGEDWFITGSYQPASRLAWATKTESCGQLCKQGASVSKALVLRLSHDFGRG